MTGKPGPQPRIRHVRTDTHPQAARDPRRRPAAAHAAARGERSGRVEHRTLAAVLARPAYNFHGERYARVDRTGSLAATLVQNHDLWLGNPALRVHIRADGHLVDCVQGLTGATFGNGRQGVTLSDTDELVVEFVEPTRRLSARRTGSGWAITQYPQ
ncbi:hypothetical protein [Nocardia sp. NPDC004750]